MAERTIPILPCGDLDHIVPFYESLGFVVTYRQQRPNPYLCVQRGGLDLHFFAVDGFRPEESMGSAIVLVPDTGRLFDEFAAGLRHRYGKLPVDGIPRITRPRRKQGTAGGFSVVDPGGNWLRISATADEDEGLPHYGVLDRVMLNAARQGDAHGDVGAAIAVLETGLSRHPEASAVERAPALVYLAELFVRTHDAARARATLAALDALGLDDAERTQVAGELLDAEEIRAALE